MALVPVLAAPNKSLAKSNKFCTGGEATNRQNRVESQSNMKTVKGDETDVAVGRRLKSLRVRCGLSQTALGMALDVSFQQIQKYERGTASKSASYGGRRGSRSVVLTVE